MEESGQWLPVVALLTPALSLQSLGPSSTETSQQTQDFWDASLGPRPVALNCQREKASHTHPALPCPVEGVGRAIGHSPKRSRDLEEVVATRSVPPRQSVQTTLCNP